MTPRQAAVLAAIVRHARDHGGQVPSLRQLMDVFGIKSTQGVQCHLDALEKKGVIVQHRGDKAQARGYRVVGLAEAVGAAVEKWAKANGVEL